MVVILNIRIKYADKVSSKTSDISNIYLSSKRIKGLEEWVESEYKNATCPFKKKDIFIRDCKSTCRKIFPKLAFTHVCPCGYYNIDDVVEVAKKLLLIYKERNLISKVKVFFKSFFNGGFHDRNNESRKNM